MRSHFPVMAASYWASTRHRSSSRNPSFAKPEMPAARGRSATQWTNRRLGMIAALDAFFASSPGTYGVLIGSPDRVLLERYSDFGAPDRATPSWSMTKAITCTLIGRMIHEGWFHSIHDPAPAPLWRDPRGIHRLIRLDHLVRMRSGLGFPVRHANGSITLGFENSAVYQDAADAFDTAQRMIVATIPGTVFRYVNSGMNVLGAVIRDQIVRRGMPYHQTVYGMLADRLGMSSYQHSADIAGNLIGSGAGFATLRDYAKLGVLYVNDGVWNGEHLLPTGWVDYATTATHTGTSHSRLFPHQYRRALSSRCRRKPHAGCRRSRTTGYSYFAAASADGRGQQ